MTQAEFKAWFEGFTEAIDKAPTQKQWARIKERIAEIDGTAITERVYIDRWVRPYWHGGPYYYSVSPTITGLSTGVFGSTSNVTNALPQNTAQAMFCAGQIEAQTMN